MVTGIIVTQFLLIMDTSISKSEEANGNGNNTETSKRCK